MFPPDFGNSTSLVTVPLEEVADAVRTTRLLIATARYRGPFSVELKRDVRDGLHKVLEINVRPWWYVEFAANCGVNVPAMMYADALGRPLPAPGSYAVGRRLVNPYYDVWAYVALRQRAELSLVTWARSWFGAGNPYLAWDDPMPGLRRFLRWGRRFVRDRLRSRSA